MEWDAKKKIYNYICKCDCWDIVKRTSYVLKTEWEKARCIQCYYKKLREEKHTYNKNFYRVYVWIKTRCTNTKSDSYYRYWWRWIKCEWATYEDFFYDMYESYLEHIEKFWGKETSIDRIDVNWNYCKENCRRSTMKEQQNNRENSISIEYNWERHNVPEWANILWIWKRDIYNKLNEGIPFKDIYNKTYKVRCRRLKLEFNWYFGTLTYWSKLLWLKRYILDYQWKQDKQQWLPFQHSMGTVMKKYWIKEIII